MRVAYVCADAGVPVFGSKGCSVHVQEVIRAMRLQGVQVDLFAARFGEHVPSDLEDVPVHSLPLNSCKGSAGREQDCLKANRDLWDLLQSHGPFDLVYERYSLWSYAGMEFASRSGCPGLLEVNAPLIEEQQQHRVLHDEGSAWRVARRVFSQSRAVLAVSEELADYLRDFPECRDRVHLLPNGVDPSRFRGRLEGRRSKAGRRFTVGFLGSLRPWHGLSILVEAFGKFINACKDAQLLVVGDGPERQHLERMLSEEGLASRSTLTGAVPPADVPAWLERMDVGVAPYAQIPGFYFSPLKVLEYMAAGLPVVASRSGQLRELIRHEENGILVAPGDAAELSGQLERLWRSPALRRELGQAAAEFVRSNCTWNSVVRRIFDLAELRLPGAEQVKREVA